MLAHSEKNQSGFFILILIISITLSFMFQSPVSAEMKQLSEIQNGIFHISPEYLEFTAKTFKTDRFIDKDQSDDFILASASKPFLPADENYEFSVIDNYTLNTDLIILYKYDSIACCPYPAKAYLSRHNISIADYTNQKSPPTVFRNIITGYEPFHNDKVTAMYFKVNNFEVTQDESIHRYPSGSIGYVSNVYANVISACITVWIGKTYHTCDKEEPVYRHPCLPKSDWPKPKQPIKLIRVSADNPCIAKPIWPEPPKKSCVIGPTPPERTTPAATNWSYNFHNNFDFMDSDQNQVYNDSSSTYYSPDTGYCPSCK